MSLLARGHMQDWDAERKGEPVVKRNLSWMQHPYRIDLPLVPDELQSTLLLPVTPASKMALRVQVEQFARYSRKELNTAMQFSCNELHQPYTAYLFLSHESAPPVWAGACCFRPADIENSAAERLDWVWMHPFLRGRSLLSKQWQFFREKHGDFFVDPPRSHAMKGFLRKNNADSVWTPSCTLD